MSGQCVFASARSGGLIRTDSPAGLGPFPRLRSRSIFVQVAGRPSPGGCFPLMTIASASGRCAGQTEMHRDAVFALIYGLMLLLSSGVLLARSGAALALRVPSMLRLLGAATDDEGAKLVPGCYRCNRSGSVRGGRTHAGTSVPSIPPYRRRRHYVFAL